LLSGSLAHILDSAVVIQLSVIAIYIEIFVWHWTLCVQSWGWNMVSLKKRIAW